MRRQQVISTELLCTECSNRMIIARKEKKQKELYHIKDLFCFKCNKVTKHIELKEIGLVEKELEFSNDLTEQEQEVYELIQKSKVKRKVFNERY